MKRILITIIMLLLIPGFLIKADSGLQISPAVSELNLKPGETYTGSFKITNNNEFKINLELTKGLKNEDNTIAIDNFKNISTEWIQTDINKVEINSQREQVFN